jgi:hypothetical protein
MTPKIARSFASSSGVPPARAMRSMSAWSSNAVYAPGCWPIQALIASGAPLRTLVPSAKSRPLMRCRR